MTEAAPQRLIDFADLETNIWGVYEIAAYTGVSKSRVGQYTQAGWFPPCIAAPRMGRAWWRPDVEKAWTAHKKTLERHRPPADYAQEKSDAH